MGKHIGQFVKPARKDPTTRKEEGILMAFGQGQGAARRGKPVDSNPYMPDQEELHLAWILGHSEDA